MTDTETAATALTATATARTQDQVRKGLLDDMKAILARAWITCPIYIGHMPPTPDTCLAIYEYAGMPPSTQIQTEAPGLQVKIRYAAGQDDYQHARTLAELVYAILHDRRNFQEGQNRYTHITAQQSPATHGRDNLQRLTFVVNFIVKKDRQA
jgi:hypothetical protein